MGLGFVPIPARATDSTATFVFPGATFMAVTADIDDDDDREVVRVTGGPASMVIESWDLVDGAWTVTFATDLQPFVAPGTRVSDGVAPLALVRTRVTGDERVLILASGYDEELGTPGCCFTVHEILDRGGRTEIRSRGSGRARPQ